MSAFGSIEIAVREKEMGADTARLVDERDAEPISTWQPIPNRPVLSSQPIGVIGLHYFRTSPSPIGNLRGVRIHFAFLIALFLLVDLLIWRRIHVRNRRKSIPHECVVCGYPLRATPDRCPECGAVPPERAPATL
jgi:hypothetical protein